MIDLFPSGPRDPQGLAQAIGDELVGELLGTRPADKLPTVVAYDAGNELTAYVDPLAAEDLLPDAPLFLAPGWYVNIPLEQTYTASWDVTPKADTRPRRSAENGGGAAVSAMNATEKESVMVSKQALAPFRKHLGQRRTIDVNTNPEAYRELARTRAPWNHRVRTAIATGRSTEGQMNAVPESRRAWARSGVALG